MLGTLALVTAYIEFRRGKHTKLESLHAPIKGIIKRSSIFSKLFTSEVKVTTCVACTEKLIHCQMHESLLCFMQHVCDSVLKKKYLYTFVRPAQIIQNLGIPGLELPRLCCITFDKNTHCFSNSPDSQILDYNN